MWIVIGGKKFSMGVSWSMTKACSIPTILEVFAKMNPEIDRGRRIGRKRTSGTPSLMRRFVRNLPEPRFSTKSAPKNPPMNMKIGMRHA